MHEPKDDAPEAVRNERGELVIFERDECGRLWDVPYEAFIRDEGQGDA